MNTELLLNAVHRASADPVASEEVVDLLAEDFVHVRENTEQRVFDRSRLRLLIGWNIFTSEQLISGKLGGAFAECALIFDREDKRRTLRREVAFHVCQIDLFRVIVRLSDHEYTAGSAGDIHGAQAACDCGRAFYFIHVLHQYDRAACPVRDVHQVGHDGTDFIWTVHVHVRAEIRLQRTSSAL